MKIRVTTGSTIYSSAENIFSEIDKSDFFTPYFVVVPDRFTLQAEKLLFDTLKIKATFNINIVGLSSLAGKILKESGLEELSSTEGVLLVQKIMLEEKDKFCYFKKSNSILCEEIFKTIQQMKSSKISPLQIKENARSKNLSSKIKDIKLIYEKYEEQRGQKLDSDDVIEVFAKTIVEKGLFKDSIFVFAGFDSFTDANYEVIASLTKTAKEVRFAALAPLCAANSFIYENDILKKLKKLALENNVEIEVTSPKENFSQSKEALVSNLFAKEIKKYSNDNFLTVAQSSSLKEEVLFVAKTIKKAVTQGARFRDFAVVCPTLEEYAGEIENIFKNFDIVSYQDQSAKFSSTPLARFVAKCFSLHKKGFQKDDILYFLTSPFVEIDNRQEAVAFVNEKNIFGKDKFDFFVKNRSLVFDLVSKIEREDTYKNYCDIILEIANFVKPKFEEMVEKELEKGFVKEATFDRQAYSALEEITSSFAGFTQKVSLTDFEQMLSTALDSKDISSLPSFCDQVFVGDSTKSFFSKHKYIFVLGANAGKLPQNSNDNGLLTDSEIEGSCFNNILKPTIKMVNKRNRFKLFSILAQAEEKLILSSLDFNEENQKQERAYFVSSLMDVFGLGKKEVIKTNAFVARDLDSLLFLLGNKDESKRRLPLLIKEKSEFAGSLREVLEYDEEKYKLNREVLSKDLTQKLFFPKGHTKVTQIEKYYDCPFKQFVDNGLKPATKQFALIKPNITGNIMHSLLEDFVKEKVKNNDVFWSDEKILEFIENNIQNYLDEDIVSFLPDRELFLKELKSNALKLCKRALYEMRYSRFVPTYFEKRFDGKELSLDGMSVVGYIDRVDLHKDMFRVVDYKTGKITTSILSSLYYGTKLQLFLYGNSLKKGLGLDFSGAFYFDAKVSYSKGEKTILKGVFSPTEKVMFALDKRLEEEDYKASDLVNVTKTKTGYAKAVLTQPKLIELENYAIEVAEKALSQMKEGNIKPCPEEESCKFCEYRGICLFEKSDKLRATTSAKDFFKKEDKDEQV